MSESRKVSIDWDKVDKLIECGNDGVRVAANLGIHPNTLYQRCEKDRGLSFSDHLAQKRARGESHILAKQYAVAMEGNTTMLIWVGKQMCSQKEEQNISASLTVQTVDYANADIPDDTTQV